MEHKDIRDKHSKESLFMAKENNDLYFFLFYRHTIRIDLDRQASRIWSNVVELREHIVI